VIFSFEISKMKKKQQQVNFLQKKKFHFHQGIPCFFFFVPSFPKMFHFDTFFCGFFSFFLVFETGKENLRKFFFKKKNNEFL